MSEYGPLEKVEVARRSYDGEILRIWGTCPSCGTRGRIDRDQYRGEVSVECPTDGCDYHETWDHREAANG